MKSSTVAVILRQRNDIGEGREWSDRSRLVLELRSLASCSLVVCCKASSRQGVWVGFET